MPLKKVKDYLDTNNIKYVIITHSPAYTAMEVAASAHIPGNELAKTVMVKIDESMTMIVLPSSYKIDFDLLKNASLRIARIGDREHSHGKSHHRGDQGYKNHRWIKSFHQEPRSECQRWSSHYPQQYSTNDDQGCKHLI